jgi:hypothetical protein
MTILSTFLCPVPFRPPRRKPRAVAKDLDRPPVSPDRPAPRLARLMALALHLEGLIQEGKVKNFAELGRLGHVTRSRISQIMHLLLLAPDIQEQLLFLPVLVRGRDPIRMRRLLPIARVLDWSQQRPLWAAMLQDRAKQGHSSEIPENPGELP